MELTKEFVNSCRNVGFLRDILCQAMDRVDALEKENKELKEAQRWRKFSKQKPKHHEFILAYFPGKTNYNNIHLRRWDEGMKFDLNFQELYTHWMPLPNAPEGDKIESMKIVNRPTCKNGASS